MNIAAPWRRIETVFFRFGQDSGRERRVSQAREVAGFHIGNEIRELNVLYIGLEETGFMCSAVELRGCGIPSDCVLG